MPRSTCLALPVTRYMPATFGRVVKNDCGHSVGVCLGVRNLQNRDVSIYGTLSVNWLRELHVQTPFGANCNSHSQILLG